MKLPWTQLRMPGKMSTKPYDAARIQDALAGRETPANARGVVGVNHAGSSACGGSKFEGGKTSWLELRAVCAATANDRVC